MPRVSIVTSCYNAAPFIGKAIESVQGQDFQDWELIIVDDGSADGSATVVQQYREHDPRIQLIRQANQGAPTTKNNGIARTDPTSEFFVMLDADDLLKPGALTFMLEYLNGHPEVGLIGGEYDFIDAQDRVITPSKEEYSAIWRYAPHGAGVRTIPDEEPDTPFATLFCWCRVIHGASMVRRSIFAQTPGYNPELPMGHDTDIFLHCALYGQVHFVMRELASYRRHGNQMTASTDPIRRGEQKLWGIWLEGKNLTPEQRQVVAAAWRFKQTRFVPHLFKMWGDEAWKTGKYREALVCYAKAVRKRYFA